MFNTKHNECVGFESRWKVKKISTNSDAQTTDYAVTDKETSITEKKNSEVQTDAITVSPGEVDMQKLADWLNSIYPKVKNELDEASSSKAFKDYKLLNETSDVNCKHIQTIDVSFNTGSGDIAYRVSALSWNSTGKTLAVTCNHDHKTWCHHSGFVSFYTLNRDNKLPDNPRKKLNTDTCVTALQFHPVLPAVIASGTYSGEINVWNIQHDDGDNIIVKVNGHSEPITQLTWINDIDVDKTLLLASSSIDGQLKLWNFSFTSGKLSAKNIYKIKTPIFARLRKTVELEEIANKIVRGILCFDFSKHVSDLFVVGIEGGLVVQCSMLGTNELKGSTKDIPILDPVVKYYNAHDGEISSICFSPKRKNMFLTSASDAEIRVYIIGQEEPAQVIHLKTPVTNITWIPHEEKIVAGCGWSGMLEIFHLIKGKAIENITNEKVSKKLLTFFSLNTTRNNMVAVGYINGELQLWNVPWHSFVA